VFRGGTLIDGTGKPPIENSVIVIDGDRFKAVGIESTIVAVGHRLYVTTAHGLFVIEKPDPAR
jgi:N-acyl-D-aspartate/D-glutamate deacylase